MATGFIALGMLLLAPLTLATPVVAEPEASNSTSAEPAKLDDLLLFPEYHLDYEPTDGVLHRTWRRTANDSYSVLNNTISDAWNLTKSPIDWRTREWLTLVGVAGATTGLVYFVDEEVRDAARGNKSFRDFGNGIRWMANGPGFLALSGGLLVSGLVGRDEEIETLKVLFDASALGYGLGAAAKYTFGRGRPPRHHVRSFDPFSGDFSMPSAEVIQAFVMASVMAERYPNWPVRILSYGLATAVGAGRIGKEDHWTSDVFVGAVFGTFVGHSVVHFYDKRAKIAEERKRLGLSEEVKGPQHRFGVSARGFRWTTVF